MIAGFLLFISPLSVLHMNLASMMVFAPSSFYGILTMIAGYVSLDSDKWLPIAGMMAVLGIILTITIPLTAWLGEGPNSILELVSLITIAVIALLDFGLITVVAKMEVFNYMDEN